MTTQRIDIRNLVRTILLIAIGIIIGVGISIGIGIGRIGNTPSSVSQRVGNLDRQTVVRDFGSRTISFNVSVGRAAQVTRLNVAALDRVAAKVVRVKSDDVLYSSLLV